MTNTDVCRTLDHESSLSDGAKPQPSGLFFIDFIGSHIKNERENFDSKSFELKIGKSNYFAALTLISDELLNFCRIDAPRIFRWLPNVTAASISSNPRLKYFFESADLFGKIRILELMHASGAANHTLDLVTSLSSGVEQSQLSQITAIVQAQRELRFEDGRHLVERFAHTQSSDTHLIEVARLATYDFLDFDLARLLISRLSCGAYTDIVQQLMRYMDDIQRRDIGYNGDAFGFSRNLSLIDNLSLLRMNWHERIDNNSVVKMVSALSGLPNWHVKRAIVSTIKKAIDTGIVSDPSVILAICVEVIQCRTEIPGVALFSRALQRSSATLTQADFRAIQCVMMATESAEERRAIARKVRQNFSGRMTGAMVTVIDRSLAESRRNTVRNERHSETQTDKRVGPTTLITERFTSAPNKANPRVALCLSGQLRSFEAHWPQIKAQIADPLGADVFISTWDKVGFGAGYGADTSRFLDPSIIQCLPAELRGLDAFFAAFPSVREALLAQPISSLKILERTEGLSAVRVHEEDAFDVFVASTYTKSLCRDGTGINNTTAINNIKMFYTMQDSFRLMEKFAKSNDVGYDSVIRMRPDVKLTDACAPSLICAPFSDDIIFVNHYHKYGVSDQFAVGTVNAMRTYMSSFELIDDHKTFDIFETGMGNIGESFIFDVLDHYGMRCRTTAAVEYELSSQVIDPKRVKSLMLHDLNSAQGNHEDLKMAIERAA